MYLRDTGRSTEHFDFATFINREENLSGGGKMHDRVPACFRNAGKSQHLDANSIPAILSSERLAKEGSNLLVSSEAREKDFLMRAKLDW